MHRYQRWIDDYLDGELQQPKNRMLEKHLQGCRSCTSLLAERRRLQLRLSSLAQAGADVPEQDFVQRILEQPGRGASGAAAKEERASRLRFWIPALSVVASLTLVLGVLSIAWYTGTETQLASTTTGTANGWTATPVVLTPEALEELREEGWNCPDFEATGLNLIAATGVLHEGAPELRMELAEGSKHVVLTERRASTAEPAVVAAPLSAPEPAAAKAPAAAGSATQGALGMLSELGARLGSDSATAVEVSKGKATLTLANATYKLESNLSVSDIERVLRRIVVTEHSRILTSPDTGNGLIDRLVRGLGRLIVLDAKQ